MFPQITRLALICFLSFSIPSLYSQTTLGPGDLAIVGLSADIGFCGFPAGSDEISIATFVDLETNTSFFLTDNGWEVNVPNVWGGTEGTILITRTGGDVPAGSIITIYCRNEGPDGTYLVVTPDMDWDVTYVNSGGGPLNHENGSDQLYIMQGGTWENHGNNADYTGGTVIYGFNSVLDWIADGTQNQSNLHPDVIPCAYHSINFGPASYLKFTAPLNPTTHLDWLDRIQDPNNWVNYVNCNFYNSAAPAYTSPATMFEIIDIEISISCLVCEGCPPFFDVLTFELPPGDKYDVVYTNGVDTFELFAIEDGHVELINVTEDVTFWIVSATPYAADCPFYATNAGQAEISAPTADPGLFASYYMCEDGPGVELWYYLNGTPDSGGTWSPPLSFGIYYYPAAHGEGYFTYNVQAGDCPRDTASVYIEFVEADSTIIEVSCDVNGTPYDIFDDRIVLDILFIAPGMAGQTIKFEVSEGSITPEFGVEGEPITCYLDPGTATGGNITLSVQGYDQFPWCAFDFEIEAPGYCSDPCDPDMEASLSGDTYICLNNCPDNPTSFNIDIDGGNPPFRMDFSITASGFPTWNFFDVGIDDSGELEICIGDVAAPTYNPATGSIVLPAALAGSYASLNLLQVYDKYDCTGFVGPAEYTMEIRALPEISPHSFSLCDDVATSVDLTQFDPYISLIYDVEWFDGNPLEGGDPVYNPTNANLENIVDLYAYVTDFYCENAIEIGFTLLPTPELQPVDSIPLCDGTAIDLGEIALVDANNSMATYTFHDSLPPDTSNQIDPLIITPEDSMVIYVHAVAGMCYDTLPIEILVEDVPSFALQGLPCDLANDTYAIIFEGSADTILANAGTVIINPSGPDTITGIPNDTPVFIQLESQTGLCIDTLTIQAPDCNCPEIAIPEPVQDTVAICEGEPIPILEVDVAAGLIVNWYSQLSGGMLLASNTTSYQPLNATSANYFAEAFDPNTNCRSLRKAVRLQVNPLPQLAAVSDQELCANETLDISSLTPTVLNAVPGSGQWTNAVSGMPVTGVLSPNDGDSFIYTYTTTAGQCVSTTDFQVTVHALPEFSLAEVVCIDSTLTYDIIFTTNADNITPDMGTLVAINADSFLLEDVPFDADISIGLLIAGTGCDTTIAFAAPDCSCPPLLAETSHMLCNDNGIVDLSSFEGAGVQGNWELVSVPAGGQPGTLVGSVFNGQNADAGVYQLAFIRSVILQDCIDTMAFTLTLRASPQADAGADYTICAGEVISLAGIASGASPAYQWTTTGGGSITNPTSLNTIYTPTMGDILNGSVGFTLTASDQTGFCPSDMAQLDVEINSSAYFMLDQASQVYCDTLDIIVDLNDLITVGNTTGGWFLPDTVPPVITGGSSLNPSDLAPGIYTLFYGTTSATPPCVDDTASVSLIIENCSCPSVAVSDPGSPICNGTTTTDLDQFLITTEPGNWQIVSNPGGGNPATLSGSMFDPEDADGGTYTLRYTLANAMPGCPEFAEITLDVVEYPELTLVSANCADDLQSWELVVVSNGSEVTTTLGNLIPQLDDHYLIEGIPLETNIQVVANNGSGLCTTTLDGLAPDCACTLAFANPPEDAIVCVGDSTDLTALVTGGNGSVTTYWVVQNDTIPGNSLTVAAEGTYTFVAEDALGCLLIEDVELTYYTEMEVDASSIDVACPGDMNGALVIEAITGGSAPYFISVSGGNFEEITAFPATLDGYGPGSYAIELEDGFGCVTSFDLVVASASQESLELGPDLTILLGDSAFLDPNLTFVPDTFYWSGQINLLDPEALGQWVAPTEDVTFILVSIDANGCIYTDEVTIRVKLESSVYVPNIFSPNGDGVNDKISPMADPTISTIDYFEIYDRWGEKVYGTKMGTSPNDPDLGWDGMLSDQPALPGVYVYRVAYTNSKGVQTIGTGDITLVR